MICHVYINHNLLFPCLLSLFSYHLSSIVHYISSGCRIFLVFLVGFLWLAWLVEGTFFCFGFLVCSAPFAGRSFLLVLFDLFRWISGQLCFLNDSLFSELFSQLCSLDGSLLGSLSGQLHLLETLFLSILVGLSRWLSGQLCSLDGSLLSMLYNQLCSLDGFLLGFLWSDPLAGGFFLSVFFGFFAQLCFLDNSPL